jgi:release factor glutamine methyltransferase
MTALESADVPSSPESRTDMIERESIEFGPLTITFDDRVLRPRPWTAAQSAWAADLVQTYSPGPRILELCSGAGHIGLLALSLVSERHPAASLVAVDLNPAACAYTLMNATAAGLEDQIDVRQATIDEALYTFETFDLVIADPPWVPSADIGQYPDDPELAIDGGDDGLAVTWPCVQAARMHLAVGGAMVLQLGTSAQVAGLRERLQADGDPLRIIAVQEHEGGVLLHLARTVEEDLT